MKAELQELAHQIGARELRFAKFQLSFSDDETYISIKKGFKRIEIKYDYDDYIVTTQKFNRKYGYGNGTDYKEDIRKNVYCDELRSIIEAFFKFEYVMDGLKIEVI